MERDEHFVIFYDLKLRHKEFLINLAEVEIHFENSIKRSSVTFIFKILVEEKRRLF